MRRQVSIASPRWEITTSEASLTAKQKRQVFDAAGASITCTFVKDEAQQIASEVAVLTLQSSSIRIRAKLVAAARSLVNPRRCR
jgi:hypothetical protein